jgi:hypothetical protein
MTGGHRSDHSNLDLVSAYHLRTHTWHALPPLPAARSAHVSLYMSGALYLIGGMVGTPQVATAGGVKLDLTTLQYSPIAPMTGGPRVLFSGCVVESSCGGAPCIVVSGGQNNAVVERYDAVRDRWVVLPPAVPHGRARPNSALCDVADKVWLMGGAASASASASTSVAAAAEDGAARVDALAGVFPNQWLSNDFITTYEPADPSSPSSPPFSPLLSDSDLSSASSASIPPLSLSAAYSPPPSCPVPSPWRIDPRPPAITSEHEVFAVV